MIREKCLYRTCSITNVRNDDNKKMKDEKKKERKKIRKEVEGRRSILIPDFTINELRSHHREHIHGQYQHQAWPCVSLFSSNFCSRFFSILYYLSFPLVSFCKDTVSFWRSASSNGFHHIFLPSTYQLLNLPHEHERWENRKFWDAKRWSGGDKKRHTNYFRLRLLWRNPREERKRALIHLHRGCWDLEFELNSFLLIN